MPTDHRLQTVLPREDRLLTTDEVLAVLDLSSDRQPTFPTFTICIACWGATGWYSPRTGSVHNRTAANQLRLLQHGVHLARWAGLNVGNATIIPHPCTCECDHAFTDVPRRRADGTSLPPRMFEHATECSLCGYHRNYDSSD